MRAYFKWETFAWREIFRVMKISYERSSRQRKGAGMVIDRRNMRYMNAEHHTQTHRHRLRVIGCRHGCKWTDGATSRSSDIGRRSEDGSWTRRKKAVAP